MHLSCDSTEELFSRRFDNRLSSIEDAAFRRHLEDCGNCREEYVRYESLFLAVLAVPPVTTEAEAPLPTGSSSFVSPRDKKPLVPRWASAAAIVLVLGGVGRLAYEYGRNTTSDLAPIQNVAEEDSGSGAIIDPTAIDLPEKSVGQRLHRTVHNSENLYLLARASKAPQADPQRLVRVIDDFIANSPLGEDARFLRSADRAGFGSYHPPVEQFAADLEAMLVEVRRELKRHGPARQRVDRIRQLMEESPLRKRSRSLRKVAGFYAFPEAQQRPRVARGKRLDPSLAFSDACIEFSFGRTSEAARRLETAVEMDDSGIRNPALYFSVFTGLTQDIDFDEVDLGSLLGGAGVDIRVHQSAIDGSQFLLIEGTTPGGKRIGPIQLSVGPSGSRAPKGTIRRVKGRRL